MWGSPNPDPFETERVSQPEKPDQSLVVDVLEWYHSTLRVGQQKKREKVIHPPVREQGRLYDAISGRIFY